MSRILMRACSLSAVALAVIIATAPSAGALDYHTGVGVTFGGNTSFGEAILDHSDTSYHKKFAFGVNVFARTTVQDGLFYGVRLGFQHLTTEVYRGTDVIGVLAMFPTVAHVETGYRTGPYSGVLRAGAGLNFSSFGIGQYVLNVEDDPDGDPMTDGKVLVSVTADKRPPVIALGASFGYDVSPLTTVLLDFDYIHGSVTSVWKVTGSNQGDVDQALVRLPFADGEFTVNDVSVTIGLSIRLSGGEPE